ncbi:hypothetical protein EYF80_033110 [Liparis tanakae]|uniref:Uncharacterized protein n=1 Tax=Liparis tanakae TaxID=230148 RepID=A0A4Z2GVB1_9TELE|nr:hypothetical protein EYF80_033110 [Liparis tanakae]
MSWAQAYQAVAVAQRHVAGVRPVLQVPGVVAARRVRAAPGQPAFLPVLHPELWRQQAALQREVQQEVVVWRGQLVEELRDEEDTQKTHQNGEGGLSAAPRLLLGRRAASPASSGSPSGPTRTGMAMSYRPSVDRKAAGGEEMKRR